MHEISDANIQLAQLHALTTYRHGLLIVALAKSLKSDGNFYIQECSQLIQQHGLLVQMYARKSLTYAEKLSVCSCYSTELYVKAIKARSKATILYAKAVTIYTQVVQGKHSAAKILLQLPNIENIY
ncbi:hypothetical protein RIVM261_056860 [Rivularia sp. IAM M-261]|nr:hypothetical protein CAL7716_038100 [Calothrix sp. PCC 7716]GJD20730.1 hypothetical protein RIVM261_056860 [Rivularia sp. IAM M-261]